VDARSEFLQKADELEEFARRLKYDVHREALMKKAQRWRDLAEKADPLIPPPRPA
jgi:hypothetical protein